MPLFNNGRTIRRALDSLLGQTFSDFRIVISDDGSTDDTTDVCALYSTRDERIELVRQPTNLNYGNFRFVLQRAESPLFMFAAGDDYWHPEFINKMVSALDRDPAAVCAVSRVEFVRNGVSVAEAAGTEPLDADTRSNLARFLAAGDDNTRMYGVFRTPVAQAAFPPDDFFAYDWAFSAGTLLQGRHIRVPEVLMWRDYTAPSRYIDYVQRDTDRVLNRLFPMLPLTSDLVFRLHIPLSPLIGLRLFELNLAFHLAYLRRHHPSAATFVARAFGSFGRAATAARRRLR